VVAESYLTVKDAARLLSLSRNTISRMIATGKLKAIKLGPRQIRIPRSAIESLAE